MKTDGNRRMQRREHTLRKILKRKHLMDDLGLQSGCVYEKHRKKIGRSLGYMSAGHVSHFVATHPRRKTQSRNRYGSPFTPSRRDRARLDSMNIDERK